MPLRNRVFSDDSSGSSRTGSATGGQTTADHNSVTTITTSTGDTALSARTAQDTTNPRSSLSDLRDQYDAAKTAYLTAIEPHEDLVQTLADMDDQPDKLPAERASEQRETVTKFAALIEISSELAIMLGANPETEFNLRTCACRITMVLVHWSIGEQCNELSEIERIDVSYAESLVALDNTLATADC